QEFETWYARWLRQEEDNTKHTAAFRGAVFEATGIRREDTPHVGEPGFKEYQAVLRRMIAENPPSGLSDQEWDTLNDRMWEFVDRALSMHATTIAGLGALARVTAFAIYDWWRKEDMRLDYWSETMARHLVDNICA